MVFSFLVYSETAQFIQMKLLYAIFINYLFTLPNYFCYNVSEIFSSNITLDITPIEKLMCNLYYLEEITIRLLLYTNDNPVYPIDLTINNLNLLRQKEKNVIIIHGYVSTSFISGPADLRNQYLERYNANVIMVDWTLLSNEFYPISVCKIPKIAEIVANFLCEVNKQINIPLLAFHIVGISLGAHVGGIIGQKTMEVCDEQIGRITGLDPAGRLYQHAPNDKRLDSSDALFVDVIHTNELSVGYYGNCGHVDFHVNCGKIQPGCPPLEELNIFSVCSHLRSVSYMLESVTSNNFIAQSCSSCPENCAGDATPEYIVMGENCPTNSTNKVFWIPTHSVSSYAAGCSLYESGCT